MALDHRKINQAWKKNQAEFFLRSTSLLYKILPTNPGVWRTFADKNN